ncbi:PREDICTED: uncharacterized protein K02A2.6-like [Wasmannia auropunctata]|uniref:uncharacterized protein K02A2.6-like n=1 Tax=Wasmannia auropunctata TaxID=64793 RepID=UPI0005EEDB0F|nr:PREDICTED: uncharacterized protein K02A2.6-like [Wasmannia auropunctata]
MLTLIAQLTSCELKVRILQKSAIVKQVKRDKGKNLYRFNNDKNHTNKSSNHFYNNKNRSNYNNACQKAKEFENGTFAPCHSCGATNHKRVDCPFKTAECHICNKVGHIAKICRSKTKSEISVIKLQGILGTGHQHRKFANIFINNKLLKMQLDTGADVTTIGTKVWKLIGCPKLQLYVASCVNASGHPIHVVGFFYATLSYKDKTSRGPIIVLNCPNIALISAQAIDELDLIAFDRDILKNRKLINVIQEDSLKGKFSKLFDNSMGECKKIKVHLRLKPDARPVHVPRRPIPLALEESLNAELDRLIENKIISPVDYSEWATPVVVARKANGKIRVCADYSTGLNNALDTDDYPIPNIEEILFKLRGNTIFSQLDLSDAYLHLKLDDESRKYTTINTHRGLFAYNRLVFGLKTAPAIFQRTLEQVLSGISGVVVYLDDILICGRGHSEHDARLHAVLTRLEEWGFRLRLEKCKFNSTSVRYLGFLISSDGIQPDPSRIHPIRSMRIPRNVKELRSFLGLINYYGKFVENLHRLKAPFEVLLKKDASFTWNSKLQKAFDDIKQILSGPLLLAHYNPKLTLIVAADASSTGIGGVLLQRSPDGHTKAVFHMLKTLTKAQQNYSQIEKEALALVTAFHQ